ncbi:MAG: hypothetical protein ACP5GH_01060 [Nitrososphaeria archaeon]|jgi:glutamyl-tRNA reductase
MTVIGLIGTSYKLTDVDFRESLIENLDKYEKRFEGSRGLFTLVTCNRVEFYFEANDPGPFFKAFEKERNRFYFYVDEQVVEHLLRVTLGLDSFMLGEESIMYQVKRSFHKANKDGKLGPILYYMLNRILSAAGKIRASKMLSGKNEIAKELAKYALSRISVDKPDVIIIGSGRTAKQIYEVVRGKAGSVTVVSSRKLFRDEFKGANILKYDGLNEALKKASVVFSATNTQPKNYLISRNIFSGFTELPKLIVDLGVPRNVDPRVSDLGIEYWDMQRAYEMFKNRSTDLQGDEIESMLKSEAERIFLASLYKKSDYGLKRFMIGLNPIIQREVKIAIKHLEKDPVNMETILRKMAERIVKKAAAGLFSNPYDSCDLEKKLSAIKLFMDDGS